MSTQTLERPETVTTTSDQMDGTHPHGSQPDPLSSTPQEGAATPTHIAMSYRIGVPDIDGRYPVIIGTDQVLGNAFRWHRDWLVATSTGEHNLRRPPVGTKGVDMAAAYLARKYAAGHITPVPLAQVLAEAPQPLHGPVPLLHPRMPITDRNTYGAKTAFAGLAAHHWRAVRTGFPGSDNHWALACELCGWEGPKFWSHLRGRNGNPPSAHRHEGGCIGEDKVRQLISAYQQ
ncbi:hypothetical protein ACFRJ1_38265 [Streptomyces sp. NPDC056773]|uniref:hypothetical protein n=1 Tax=unclassified Streptomyces TaxID=2593676 RepID=UPI00368ACAC3